MKLSLRGCRIGVVGLGYVGLPLAVEFGKHFDTVGFDIKKSRIDELKSGKDSTLECSPAELKSAKKLRYSSNLKDLASCRVFIVTVPTPVDRHNRPDLTPLERSSETVGKALKKGDVVIYESTVYPGCTEEVCVPILERISGLKFNKDFFAGYSPERINPGDKEHRLPSIKKVTAGSTPEVAEFVDGLYRTVVRAGTHKASSIRVAEAAKVIENTQRDVNIALINELALLFNRLGIDTEEVLLAAGSKWNFLPFRPGLVGGHCIGVDPYYLTHKAQEIGFHPEMILAGRRLNDSMANYVAGQVVKLMASRKILAKGSKVLVLGLGRWRTWCASSATTEPRWTCSIRGSIPRKPSTNTAFVPSSGRAMARTMPRCSRWGTSSSATWASPTCARPARRTTSSMTSSTYSRQTRSMAASNQTREPN